MRVDLARSGCVTGILKSLVLSSLRNGHLIPWQTIYANCPIFPGSATVTTRPISEGSDSSAQPIRSTQPLQSDLGVETVARPPVTSVRRAIPSDPLPKPRDDFHFGMGEITCRFEPRNPERQSSGRRSADRCSSRGWLECCCRDVRRFRSTIPLHSRANGLRQMLRENFPKSRCRCTSLSLRIFS